MNQSGGSEGSNNGGDSKMDEFLDGRLRGRSLLARIAVYTSGGRRLERKSFRLAADPFVDICKRHDPALRDHTPSIPQRHQRRPQL
jgi:hypothetical protein